MDKFIKNSGLDETEAKVYLALLELGPATVSQITKKAGITRTLGYHALQKLGWQGLVNRVSGEGAKIVYGAEHPRRLIQSVKNKQNQLAEQAKEMEQLLPELVSFYKVAEKPVVRYQDGIEGIKAIYEETLESKSEIISILDIEGWEAPEFRDWAKNYNRERSARKINERILFLDTPPGREWMKNYRGSFKYTEYRWIKPEQIPGIKDFSGEIDVFENKVMMALLKKPNAMGVLIESSTLANILKGLFELAWLQGVPARKK